MLWMVLLSAVSLWAAPAYQISPKPCYVDGMEGTCMFVWECIKSEGYHIGMCVDTFMFGSCCAHNITENTVLPQYSNKPSILYTPPSHHSHVTRKPTQNKFTTSRLKTTSKPKGSIQTTKSTISSPSNDGRPNQSTKPATVPTRFTLKPPLTQSGYHVANSILVHSKPGWQTTTEPGFITLLNNQNTISTQTKPVTLYQFTTEPGFVTKQKTKPPYNKPTKPTKKPLSFTTGKSTIKFSSKTTSTSTTTTTKPTTRLTTTIQSVIPINPSQESSTEQMITSTSTISAVPLHEARSSCGVPSLFPQPQMRIVGGKDAPFGRWPWQVSVRRFGFLTSTHRCGGAILNENWIATAGHCVDDLMNSQIRIRVGEYDFSNMEEMLPHVERGVVSKIVHPKYNFYTYEYDLALVKLDKPLDFAPHIMPICLPGSDDLLVGENATVTGWGRLSEGGLLPTVLQEVHVPIVSNEDCKSMFLQAGRHEYIPDIFLCAGHETGGKDSCQGDSGGPLQVRGKDGRYFLAGIISWGIGCAEKNLPGVCTRISKFVPWILKNVT
ncbi:serine proteinase stubble isoform X2 [Onthophagus taurus]|nr:serine proteinase stubble isoform X2 [Onthophagus taurus]